MLAQTFEYPDLITIVALVVLEGLLSADNALVLAIMVRHLPDQRQQRRALTIGLAMSFVFRFAAILLVTWLIGLWWLQAIGAAYLLYLPIKHFRHYAKGDAAGGKTTTFGRTVVALGLADVAFAIDSVVAAVAMVAAADKVWIVVIGALAGVIMLRYAATFFIGLLDKYPLLDHLAFVLIGWVGVKLAFMAGHNCVEFYESSLHVPEMSQTVFWSVLAVLVVGGVSLAVSRAKAQEAEAAGSEADRPSTEDEQAR
ncbi:MAG: hypothetical protein IH945_01130 [Armatimonadetes bacterium]|nr:hypothetical protein [Armatimonadota bacterium]